MNNCLKITFDWLKFYLIIKTKDFEPVEGLFYKGVKPDYSCGIGSPVSGFAAPGVGSVNIHSPPSGVRAND